MKLKAIAVLSLLGAMAACVSSQKNSQAGPEWISNMHRLSTAHLQLMPYVTDGRKFADPGQRAHLKQELNEMAQAVTGIINDNKAPDADPVIAYTAMELAGEVKQAYGAFENGDLQSSRFSLNRISSYCITCHTRADRGARDYDLGWNASLSGLAPMQQVEYLLANRRYQSAIAKAEVLAADKKLAQSEARAWIINIEKVLAMIVRVNKDSVQAERLVKIVAANPAAPYYVRRDAASWLKDIRQWRGEKRGDSKPLTFKSAMTLVQRAQRAGPRNPAALILYLRASGMLHELLEDTKSSHYGEALLYAGIVSDSLRDLSLGFLDQYYYQSCIKSEPHSELAEMCYSRLEASVRASNPFIELQPVSDYAVSAQLAQYRKLAEVKDLTDFPSWKRRPWEEFQQWEVDGDRR